MAFLTLQKNYEIFKKVGFADTIYFIFWIDNYLALGQEELKTIPDTYLVGIIDSKSDFHIKAPTFPKTDQDVAYCLFRIFLPISQSFIIKVLWNRLRGIGKIACVKIKLVSIFASFYFITS